MIAQCWLHIGTKKTGTTSIQKYLAHNRSALLSRELLYPRTAGRDVHLALSAYALDDHKFETTRAALGIRTPEQLAAFRREFPAALRAELDASGATTLILSNEYLAAGLRSASEFDRIRGLCDSLAAKTRILVYVRNQVDFLVSQYRQSIVDGNAKDFIFDNSVSADYSAMLARWSAAFGRENIVLRRFEDARLRDGDLLADFAGELNVDLRALARVPPANTSLDAESIKLVRLLNRRFLPASRGNYLRRSLVALLRRRRGGTRFVIARDLAEKIDQAFRVSNERLAAEYLGPEDMPLFLPPSSVHETGATPVTRLDIGSYLWIAAMLLPGAAYLALSEKLRRRAA